MDTRDEMRMKLWFDTYRAESPATANRLATQALKDFDATFPEPEPPVYVNKPPPPSGHMMTNG